MKDIQHSMKVMLLLSFVHQIPDMMKTELRSVQTLNETFL